MVSILAFKVLLLIDKACCSSFTSSPLLARFCITSSLVLSNNLPVLLILSSKSALLEDRIRSTGKLLDKTRELVIQNLAKSGEEVKDEQQALSIRSKTLNARIETIESKPSFKDVSFKRGILFVDGFFEFKHEGSKKIPHYIFNVNPIGIGTILSEWINPSTGEIISTFSIVTHKASNVLKCIHNNPKLKEPRSPLFIDINNKSSWINDNDLNYLHKISGEIEQNLKFHEVNIHF